MSATSTKARRHEQTFRGSKFWLRTRTLSATCRSRGAGYRLEHPSVCALSATSTRVRLRAQYSQLPAYNSLMSHRHEPMAVGRLRLAFMLSAAILVAEVAGGLLSHSLGLSDAGANLNVKSALLHVVGDVAASAGVLAAGAAIALTGVFELDPIVGIVVSILICLGAWRIIGQALGILMEGAPPGLNMAEMIRQIMLVP